MTLVFYTSYITSFYLFDAVIHEIGTKNLNLHRHDFAFLLLLLL